jgi:hypothetical protein
MAISPDDTDRPFVARWNALVSALLVEPSIKLVARQACDYGIMDGESIYPGNERLARQTGYDERTVREVWHFLRATGMAYRGVRSAWTGDHRTADMYALEIPSGWRAMPVLGPNAGRFTCQQCGKKFNPPPCNTFLTQRDAGGKTATPAVGRDGLRDVRWSLWKAVFCPPPRSGNGCRVEWERSNGPWNGGQHNWDLFGKARNDEWPEAIRLAA